MTQHYKDEENNLYGYKPNNIDVTPITMEEVHQINESKITPEQILQQQLADAQQYLTDTDYVVVKMAEAMVAGEDITAMKAQYADVISEREVKRTFIGENS